MVITETVRISRDLKIFLDKKRRYDRETYNDIIKRLLKKVGYRK